MSMLTYLVHKEVYIRWVDGSAGCFKILSHDGVLVKLQPLQRAPIDAPRHPFRREPFYAVLSSIAYLQEAPAQKPSQEKNPCSNSTP